jgi:hypothetical protein
MEKNTHERYLEVLEVRMVEISNLNIMEPEKRTLVKSLFSRYTTELKEDLKSKETSDDVIKSFNHYINNILSILETLSNKDAFKPMRRLILNEIHGCKDQIILILNAPK